MPLRSRPGGGLTLEHEAVVRRIRGDEAVAHRDLRLRALLEARTAFGSTHAQASARSLAARHARTIACAESESSALFVLDSSARLLGLLGAEIEDPGPAHLTSMWVDPRVRGRGLGRALLEVAAAWAAERQTTVLHLWVTEGNTHAIALYEASAFAFTGESQPHPSRRALSELEMQRPSSLR